MLADNGAVRWTIVGQIEGRIELMRKKYNDTDNKSVLLVPTIFPHLSGEDY